ncbi:MAG: DUF417 family protein [Chitinophagaceae bacterium]
MISTTANAEMHNATRLEAIGAGIIRYGLAIVLLWVGMLKFTSYEAEGIKPLVENSPFLYWAYGIMSVQGFSMVLGVTEIILGILIASRPFSPKASAIGMATRVWVSIPVTNAGAVYSERSFISGCGSMDSRGGINGFKDCFLINKKDSSCLDIFCKKQLHQKLALMKLFLKYYSNQHLNRLK